MNEIEQRIWDSAYANAVEDDGHSPGAAADRALAEFRKRRGFAKEGLELQSVGGGIAWPAPLTAALQSQKLCWFMFNDSMVIVDMKVPSCDIEKIVEAASAIFRKPGSNEIRVSRLGGAQ